jgi:hypothetical protein
MRGVFLIDAGQTAAGAARIAGAAAQMRETSTRFARVASVWELSLQALLGEPAGLHAGLAAEAGSALLTLPPDALLNERVEVSRLRHVLAWLAARSGRPDLARVLVAPNDDSDLMDGHPILRQHASVSAASILCAEDNPEAGLSRLKAELDQLDGLYSLRVAAIDCLRRTGDWAGMESHARWLSEHRGRAYAEMHGDYGLIAFNVAYSTLALLDLTESLQSQGREVEARAALDQFLSVWPSQALPRPVADRVQALQPQT